MPEGLPISKGTGCCQNSCILSWIYVISGTTCIFRRWRKNFIFWRRMNNYHPTSLALVFALCSCSGSMPSSPVPVLHLTIVNDHVWAEPGHVYFNQIDYREPNAHYVTKNDLWCVRDPEIKKQHGGDCILVEKIPLDSPQRIAAEFARFVAANYRSGLPPAQIKYYQALYDKYVRPASSALIANVAPVTSPQPD